jgi:release factor glutamine methyltransferase
MEMMSLLEVLQGAAKFLDKQGVEQPRLNAEHLLAHVLGVKRLELYLQFDRPLGEKERAPLRDLVRKRGKGVPLQHLLGTVEFCGRTFLCDSRALIPRTETEQLVERALTYKTPSSRPRSILDVATGSGIIALSLALEWPEAKITATDISQLALSLAHENALLHGVTSVEFLEADLLPPTQKNDQFDLITANLPYISSVEIPTLSREVQYDPTLALDGGVGGLDLINRFIPLATTRLIQGGHILLEIGKDQDLQVMECLERHNYSDILALPDYQGVLRFIEAAHG